MATHKSRVPLQVSEKFVQKLKEIQRKVRMNTGDNKSLRQITDDLVTSPIFDDFEKILANNQIKLDIQVRMDRRRR